MPDEFEITPEEEMLLEVIEKKAEEIRSAFEAAETPLTPERQRAAVAFVFQRLSERAARQQKP